MPPDLAPLPSLPPNAPPSANKILAEMARCAVNAVECWDWPERRDQWVRDYHEAKARLFRAVSVERA